MHILCAVRNLITGGAARGLDGDLSVVSDFSGWCKGPGHSPAALAWFSVHIPIKGGCLTSLYVIVVIITIIVIIIIVIIIFIIVIIIIINIIIIL
ncbi:hypothetical protein DUI87_10715 [Hirundo rustica rustica]|uniref:Uncharacterized protein n=1 Tax=Hirundo rustica rustica TaxID=333673 RepID=A0A3M0KIW1_HIRRU|nr:hypothetical protein DUI87_10715 [Hirundo rustica rustica]